MERDDVDAIAAAQAELLAALDARDVAAIEAATAGLAEVLARIRAMRPSAIPAERKADLDRALRQNDAARMRINVMSEATARRAEAIARFRGLPAKYVYTRQ